MKPKAILLAALAIPLVAACSEGGAGNLPDTAPERVTLVTSDGFERPGDAVSTPDGETFVFTAFALDEDRSPSVFRVPSAGGSVTPLHTGDPLAYPTGLVMSCDGDRVYVADQGLPETDAGGAIYTLSVDGGAPAALSADGILRPSGLALSVDCDTLYVTGWNDAGQPAVFTVPADGGAATELYGGAPLASPTGVHVDADSVAWVMEHSAGGEGLGALYAINASGELNEVVTGLRIGSPGGVSLAAGGDTAVIPTVDGEGNAQLVTIRISTGETIVVDTPELIEPAGIRTAREAGVFALVDSEGGAIYRAE